MAQRRRRPWPDFTPWGVYLRASSKRLRSLACDRCEAWLRRELEGLGGK